MLGDCNGVVVVFGYGIVIVNGLVVVFVIYWVVDGIGIGNVCINVGLFVNRSYGCWSCNNFYWEFCCGCIKVSWCLGGSY